MEMKLHTLLEALRYCSHTMAGHKDNRYYLRGVGLETAGECLTFVGTDGHRIAWVETRELGTLPLGLPERCVLAGEPVTQLLKACKLKASEKASAMAVLRWDAEGMALRVRVPSGIECALPAIRDDRDDRTVATLPVSWRRIAVRGSEAPAEIGLNLRYLADGAAALAKLANQKYHGGMLETVGPTKCGALTMRTSIAKKDFPELECASLKIMGMRV
jgi:hypothetical protein